MKLVEHAPGNEECGWIVCCLNVHAFLFELIGAFCAQARRRHELLVERCLLINGKLWAGSASPRECFRARNRMIMVGSKSSPASTEYPGIKSPRYLRNEHYPLMLFLHPHPRAAAAAAAIAFTVPAFAPWIRRRFHVKLKVTGLPGTWGPRLGPEGAFMHIYICSPMFSPGSGRFQLGKGACCFRPAIWMDQNALAQILKG